MIIDSFIFFAELDMLEFRLKTLWDRVDKFVIAEADHTFSGVKKPYYFQESRARFAWAESKIVHHPIKASTEGLNLSVKPETYDPAGDSWKIEHQLRNSILDACASFSDGDMLILSDVDEMPSKEAFAYAMQNPGVEPLACRQDFYYYNLRTLRDELWCGSVFSTLGVARHHGFRHLRDRRFYWPRIENGGWHLSHFGKPEHIQRKLATGSHQEINTKKFGALDHILQCIKEGKDLYDRDISSTRPALETFPMNFLINALPYGWGIGYRDLPAVIFKKSRWKLQNGFKRSA